MPRLRRQSLQIKRPRDNTSPQEWLLSKKVDSKHRRDVRARCAVLERSRTCSTRKPARWTAVRSPTPRGSPEDTSHPGPQQHHSQRPDPGPIHRDQMDKQGAHTPRNTGWPQKERRFCAGGHGTLNRCRVRAAGREARATGHLSSRWPGWEGHKLSVGRSKRSRD